MPDYKMIVKRQTEFAVSCPDVLAAQAMTKRSLKEIEAIVELHWETTIEVLGELETDEPQS